MNEYSSTNPSTSAARQGLTAEAISRRAYEIWEKEGRPENRDLQHWLRAEQELASEQPKAGGSAVSSKSANRLTNSDTQPLQGTRAAAAANRDTKPAGKRATSTAPFPSDKQGPPRSTSPGMRNESGRTGGRV